MSEDECKTLVPPTPVVVGLVSEEDRAIRTLRVVVWLQAFIAVLYGLGYGFLSVYAYEIVSSWPGLVYDAAIIWGIFLVVVLNGVTATGLFRRTRWAFISTHLLPVLLCTVLAVCLLLQWQEALARESTPFLWEIYSWVLWVLFGIPLLLYLILMTISIILLRRAAVRALFYPGVAAHRP